MDGYQKDSEETITRVEMQRISNAIRRFKADTGYWPKTGPFSYKTEHTKVPDDKPNTINSIEKYRDAYFNNPANFWWLFDQPNKYIGNWDAASDKDSNPIIEPIWKWDVDTGMGWHGPYINRDAIKTIATDSVQSGCSTYTQAQLQITIDKPHFTYPDHIIRRFNGLVDRFQQIRKKNTGKDYCVLTRDKKNMKEFKVAEYSASPYLYETEFTHDEYELCDSDESVDCIVLRSFGADGKDGYHSDAEDEDKYDDIVFVLQVN
jgi:hypothetical protein